MQKMPLYTEEAYSYSVPLSAIIVGYPLGVSLNLNEEEISVRKQRAEIDAIDREIVALFERRMQVVVDVALN